MKMIKIKNTRIIHDQDTHL